MKPLARCTDEELLARPLDSLGLHLGARNPAAQRLRARMARLEAELAAKGLAFRPHVWLSTDFFSPDGVPGFALPFYLAHPRLLALERSRRLSCEGQAEGACLRLLRHEAGHAVDTAYGLHRERSWRRLFGQRSAPYLRSFRALHDFIAALVDTDPLESEQRIPLLLASIDVALRCGRPLDAVTAAEMLPRGDVRDQRLRAARDAVRMSTSH